MKLLTARCRICLRRMLWLRLLYRWVYRFRLRRPHFVLVLDLDCRRLRRYGESLGSYRRLKRLVRLLVSRRIKFCGRILNWGTLRCILCRCKLPLLRRHGPLIVVVVVGLLGRRLFRRLPRRRRLWFIGFTGLVIWVCSLLGGSRV